MERSAKKWRVFGAIGVLGAVSVGALTSSVAPAAGEEPPAQLEPVGVLRLNLSGSAGKFTFTPAGGGPTVTQKIIVDAKCGVSLSGPPAPELVKLTNSGGPGLGLVSHGIGVRQKATCSPAEGRIGGSEMVTLALGSYFDEQVFGEEVFVDRAELEIEGKFNASVDVSLDGQPAENRPLVTSSDNGPDSGIGDNNRVIVSKTKPDELFRAITLSAPTGEVSLEGGGDGSYAQYKAAGKVGTLGQSLNTADTILRVVRVHEFADELSCDETVSTSVIGGTAAEVTRLDNTDTEDCAGNEDVGVTFEVAEDGVFLDKGTISIESGTPQAVNALVKIVWAPQPADTPLPTRQINIHPDEDPDDFHDVQWCLSWDPDPADMTAGHPPNVPWCLVDDQAVLQEDGTVVQTQMYHGAGDPRWH